MIESISIAGVASYTKPPQEMAGLSKFNFLFGSNGTGKTTISRIIADENIFPECRITWKSGIKLQCLVYNHDFVDHNFHQAAELKGVFTLGEKQNDILEKIAASKADLDKTKIRIEKLNQGLQDTTGESGKRPDLARLETLFKEKCWAQKQKHDAKLLGAFEGVRNSAEKFKARILQEQTSNTANLLPLAELVKKAESIFGLTPIKEPLISVVDSAKLLAHETSLILAKRVVGKEDVDIAAMIKRLGNSDWVRQGRTFFEGNNGVCPFCQQDTQEAFSSSLTEYFDEAFTADTKAIDDLANSYTTDATRLQQQLASIIALPSKFLNIEKLNSEKDILDTKILLNCQRIAGKKKEASRAVELDSISDVSAAIKDLIATSNAEIIKHNNTVENLTKERATLKAQVWKFILEEIKTDLNDFTKQKESLEKAIQAMTKEIEICNEEAQKKTSEIRELEKQTTSIQPTIDGINALLSSFGFQGFKLAKAVSGTSYKLVRPDGSDAKATLSEGEKTFVTFLYFYHLLKGSESDSGMTTDRLVVFDDPVSSLDSDVLFIVGSLIKGLFDDTRSGIGHIKQIFILTHNVYFHKEVTFNPRRRNNEAMHTEETFWIVRRLGLTSKIERYNSNPIKTSYELLWMEVRRSDRSVLTIQNTLRRILENYFKILGGVDSDDICSRFDGKERLICKSLFSWINDGSHFAHDDLYISDDGSTAEIYLKVFRDIFRKLDHLSHYKMMMGDSYIEEPDLPTAAEA